MDMSKKQYSEIVGKTDPKSPIWKDMSWAFVIGGLICVIGQILMDVYMKNCGCSKKDAAAWVRITLIGLSALFTALNWYGKLAKHAGGGTLVPITGFANSVVAPAIEFKSEGHIFGIGAKMFIMAGPVIVFGVISSVVYGIIFYIFSR